LGVRLLPSGKGIAPTLPEADRIQRVSLPDNPSVGEVIGLAVSGDHSCILRFEMQATKGSGRIVPLGSIQKVMRESIEAAAQYIKARHEDAGVKDVLLPNENVKEAQGLPSYILDAVTVIPVETVEDVLKKALLNFMIS
jgi:ATP-dependent Lon protease